MATGGGTYFVALVSAGTTFLSITFFSGTAFFSGILSAFSWTFLTSCYVFLICGSTFFNSYFKVTDISTFFSSFGASLFSIMLYNLALLTT